MISPYVVPGMPEKIEFYILHKEYGISKEEIIGRSRKREIVTPRQILMWYYHKILKKSSTEVGVMIGRRDHATVLHACTTVNNLMETDKEYRDRVKSFLDRLI